MKIEIIRVAEKNIKEVFSFLNHYEETAQFLIGNLKAQGPNLTEHQHSGNYKMLLVDDEIKGIFYLTQMGTLLAQIVGDYSEPVLLSCLEENIPIKGFIGDWSSVSSLYEKFKEKNSKFKTSYESKEILYRYCLKADDHKLVADERVRLLQASDYEDWKKLSDDYNLELNLPDSGTAEQVRVEFEKSCAQKIRWGLFIDGKLISIAALNSVGEGTGQVGGVFTPKNLRQRGYSKATMLHLLKDCRDLHGHSKNILFTGQADIAAQKLYESIGYERIGHFGLVFGE